MWFWRITKQTFYIRMQISILEKNDWRKENLTSHSKSTNICWPSPIRAEHSINSQTEGLKRAPPWGKNCTLASWESKIHNLCIQVTIVLLKRGIFICLSMDNVQGIVQFLHNVVLFMLRERQRERKCPTTLWFLAPFAVTYGHATRFLPKPVLKVRSCATFMLHFTLSQ